MSDFNNCCSSWTPFSNSKPLSCSPVHVPYGADFPQISAPVSGELMCLLQIENSIQVLGVHALVLTKLNVNLRKSWMFLVRLFLWNFQRPLKRLERKLVNFYISSEVSTNLKGHTGIHLTIAECTMQLLTDIESNCILIICPNSVGFKL